MVRRGWACTEPESSRPQCRSSSPGAWLWRADDVVQFSQTFTAGIRVGFEDGEDFRLSTGELLVAQPGERSFEIDLGPE